MKTAAHPADNSSMKPSPVAQNSPDQTGGPPAILSALVAPRDDPRQFRRYPVRLNVGISSLPEEEPKDQEDEKDKEKEDEEPLGRLIYRSVEIHDLSLTGCRFLSAVPYRVGVLLEIQLPLPHQLLTLPCRVQRLETTAQTPGAQTMPFACGVNFLQSRMPPENRRTLMEFLMRQSS